MFIQFVQKSGEVATKQVIIPNFEPNHSVSTPKIVQVALIMILQGEGRDKRKLMRYLRCRDLRHDCGVEEIFPPGNPGSQNA